MRLVLALVSWRVSGGRRGACPARARTEAAEEACLVLALVSCRDSGGRRGACPARARTRRPKKRASFLRWRGSEPSGARGMPTPARARTRRSRSAPRSCDGEAVRLQEHAERQPQRGQGRGARKTRLVLVLVSCRDSGGRRIACPASGGRGARKTRLVLAMATY